MKPKCLMSLLSAFACFIILLSVSTPLTSAYIQFGDDNSLRTLSPAIPRTGITVRISIASDGTQGDEFSGNPSISADGRYIAFSSSASNLVNGDTNGYSDIFVHDQQTGVTTRVSVASDGIQANGNSYAPSISANGRYVAFSSYASNLVNGDTNGCSDIFVHDQQTGSTTRVSINSNGVEANWESVYTSISADGRYVAFLSSASNLVDGDTNECSDRWGGNWINGQCPDIFVHDRQTGQTTRVSIASDGTQANDQSEYPTISADGRYVAFTSLANNLVSNDTNGLDDIFIHDRQTGQTSLVSVASDGTQGNARSFWTPALSTNGRFVAFQSAATNLVSGDNNGWIDVFLRDRQTNQTFLISIASNGTQGNIHSTGPSISADGRYITFVSRASNLVMGDTNNSYDVFIRDWQNNQTIRASVAFDGTQANADSGIIAAVSADGNYVAFSSYASNLVTDDTNGYSDVFVYDRVTGSGAIYSISGRVTDDSNNPASGVTITSSSGSSTTTNASGYYTFTNVITGTYAITPTKSGYIFAPITRTVSVPPNKTGQDFKARPIPTRFLTLPVATTNPSQDAIARVNSWFDHESPDYGLDYQIRKWLGNSLSYPSDPCPTDNPNCKCTLKINCYAGHNGIDFSKREPNQNTDEPVYAAYSGVVSSTLLANTGYGNRVWINHQNGYATLYGHLKSISVTVGSSINTGQPVGIMGTTGRSTGIHLHFGVYYDKDGNEQWTEDEEVDPYGWFGTNANWAYNSPAGLFIPNGQLWNFPILPNQNIGTGGGTLTSPSGNIKAIIPAGALTSTLTLRFGDVTLVAAPSAQLRTTGRSFLLQVLEWLGITGQGANARRPTSSFAQPVTLQVTYGAPETLHLDTNQMKIYYWDENAGAWSALQTTIDTNLKMATAQTTAPGNFDLQAPLICPADAQEIDDNFYASKSITPNGTSVNRLFDIAQDEDWIRFDATGGKRYIIQTSNLSTGVDTILQVYDIDGVTMLASDDNSGGGKASRLSWQAPQAGTYFVRVSQAPGSAFGCATTYQVSITQQQDFWFFLPFIRK